MKKALTTRFLPLIALTLLSGCATTQPRESATPMPAETTPATPSLALPEALANARQLILVTAPGWDSPQGELHRYERHGAMWHNVGQAHAVSLGRNGMAWGLGLHSMPQPGPQKLEGDGRSPAGVFALPGAFGYAEQQGTALPYTPMRESHYCIDVADSPLYNRIVDAADVGQAAVKGSTEPMRLDLHNAGDPRYALGILVDHNPQAIPGKGSCIFIHLRRSIEETTAGCTSMEEANMQALLNWIDPRQMPVFVLLPESEHLRLQPHWALPTPALLK